MSMWDAVPNRRQLSEVFPVSVGGTESDPFILYDVNVVSDESALPDRAEATLLKVAHRDRPLDPCIIVARDQAIAERAQRAVATDFPALVHACRDGDSMTIRLIAMYETGVGADDAATAANHADTIEWANESAPWWLSR